MTSVDVLPNPSDELPKGQQLFGGPLTPVNNEEIYPGGDTRRKSDFDNINVVVRVRALRGKITVQDKNRDPASLFPAAGQVQVHDPISGQQRSFTFDVVFEPEATQAEVFEHSGAKRLIDMALEGFASTIFAYGQTGSGKTFTLTGNVFESLPEMDKDVNHNTGHNNHNNNNHNNNNNSVNHAKEAVKKCVGLVQLSFAYLFEQIKLRKDRGVFYVVTASYLEIYNEQVLDLLNPSPKSLNVRWSKDRGFYAENLFKVECEDIGDLEGVLEEGIKNRQVRSHQMNDNSSRSHTLLTLSLASETQDPEDPQGYIRREGRICLVDLAGSEKTKRTLSKGDTLVEANNINRSLLVLGNCIAALASPRRRAGHIPYRDSTLTKLLADSLSGSGMTLMIACVSPHAQDASETINTLRYAARAKKVKTNPVVRMDPRELLILSLKREVRLLRMENNYLRQQLNLGNGFLENVGKTVDQRPSSDDSSTSPTDSETNNQRKKETSKLNNDLLHKYMKDNETLRAENAQLHMQRERLIRDHERVCRENERLKRRIETPNEERGVGDNRMASIVSFDGKVDLTTTITTTNNNEKSSQTNGQLKGTQKNGAKSKGNELKHLLNGHTTDHKETSEPMLEVRGVSAAASRRIPRR